MGLKKTFEKQGGMKLLKQYWQCGAFFTAVGEVPIVGQEQYGFGDTQTFHTA